MNELINLSRESIIKYFSTLSLLGYKNYDSVYSLIFLLIIEELINGSMHIYIDEGDYKSIINALYCICGSDCMIDFPKYDVFDCISNRSSSRLHARITEDFILRGDQNNTLRKV